MTYLIDQRIHNNTLRIRTANGTGTAFLVEVEDTVFLFTAAHCVKDTRKGDKIYVSDEAEWKRINDVEIGFHKSGFDCAIIKTKFEPRGGITPADFGTQMFQGQRLAYCGFPLGLEMVNDPNQNTLPIAFMRSGDLSGWYNDNIGAQQHLLDSYGNRGFSGGPVVGLERGIKKIFGVVSGGYLEKPDPILVRHGKNERLSEAKDSFYRLQSGFTRFLRMEYFLEIVSDFQNGTNIGEPIVIEKT